MKHSPDHATQDLDKFLSMQDAAEIKAEQNMDRARAEFAAGELDDEIRDRVADEPMDAVNIALAAVYNVRPDAGDRNKGAMYRAPFPPSQTDFYNMVEDVISGRAERMAEEL